MGESLSQVYDGLQPGPHPVELSKMPDPPADVVMPDAADEAPKQYEQAQGRVKLEPDERRQILQEFRGVRGSGRGAATKASYFQVTLEPKGYEVNTLSTLHRGWTCIKSDMATCRRKFAPCCGKQMTA